MEPNQRLTPYPLRGGWTLITSAALTTVAAIWGYFLLIPFETAPDLATLALIAFGLFAVYREEKVPSLLQWEDYLVILVLTLVVAISTALSDSPVKALGFLVYLLINLFLLLLATTLRGRRAAELTVFAIAVFGVIHVLALLFSGQSAGATGADSIVKQAGLATLIVPNDALILGLCLPSLMFALLDRGRWRLPARVILVVYVLSSVFICHLLQSKVALLSIVMAVLMMLIFRFMITRRGKVRLKLLPVISTLSGFILFAGGLALYLGNQSTTRLSLWWEAATAHTSVMDYLFGSGPNSFLYNPTAIKPLFDGGDLIIPWVHNLYLETWHDLGLLGLLTLIAMTVLPIIRALRIKDGNMGAMILASMTVFILAAMLEVTLTRRFYFAFLALFYGLALSQTLESSHENTH